MNVKDKRVKRTKKILKHFFVELLNEKSIRNITVSELAERADISRAAFYSHYEDIYDLYNEIENELLEEMSALMTIDSTRSYVEVYKALIDYIYDNPAVCKVFMGRNSDSTFREKLIDVFEEKTMQQVLCDKNATESKPDWKYINRFTCDGTVSMFSMWIESDFAYSKDNMIDIINRLDKQCFALFV